MSTFREAFDAEMGFTMAAEPADIATRLRYYEGDQVEQGDLPQDVYNAMPAGLLNGPTGKRFGVNLCKRFVAGKGAMLNVDGCRVANPDDLAAIEAGDKALAQLEKLTADGQPIPPELAATVAAAEGLTTAADWVWERCQAAGWAVMWNRLDTLASVAGIGYLVLGFDDDGVPTLHHNAPVSEAGGAGIEPGEVDDEGRLRSATKWYTETRYVDNVTGRAARFIDWLLSQIGIRREREAIRTELWKWRVIYEEQVIRRFVTPPNGQERAADLEQDGAEPETPWFFSTIPVIPFTSPVGNELDDILPLQQLLNHAVLSLQQLALVQGFPVTWTIDADVAASTAPVDTSSSTTGRRTRGTTNDAPQIVAGPGALLSVDTRQQAQGQAQVTRLPAADLAQSMDAIKLYAELACWLNGYPSSRLPWNHNAQPPSGEAVKRLEQPMLDKVELYQEQYTPALQQTFKLLQEMAGRKPVDLMPVWRENTFSDPQAAAQVALSLQGIGADPETLLDLFDLTPAQKERALAYIEQIDAERAQRVADNLGDLLTPQGEARDMEPVDAVNAGTLMDTPEGADLQKKLADAFGTLVRAGIKSEAAYRRVYGTAPPAGAFVEGTIPITLKEADDGAAVT